MLPTNTTATAVSATFHTFRAYVALVSRAVMPAGSALILTKGLKPSAVASGDALAKGDAASGSAAWLLAATNSRECVSCAASRAASRKRHAASGNNAACENEPPTPTTPSAVHMPARTSQSKTQHTAVTRRKKRALPQIAASRHCSTVSALAYRILRNGPASGGGGPPFGAGLPPRRRARVALRIAVVSFRATATATSSKMCTRVSLARRPIQLQIASGQLTARDVAKFGSANRTAPQRLAVCSAAKQRSQTSSTRKAEASLDARRSRRTCGARGSATNERDRDAGPKNDRAHVSATSKTCACRVAAPSRDAKTSPPSVHATIVTQVMTSVAAVSTTPATCALSDSVSPGARGPVLSKVWIHLRFSDSSSVAGAVNAALAAQTVCAAPREDGPPVFGSRTSAFSRHQCHRTAPGVVVPGANAPGITPARRRNPIASKRTSNATVGEVASAYRGTTRAHAA
mmetsp:Transcript_9063/g.30204  ORF Transcript_9063/g.30204 Transcript_9063/m.30204 type:complete len:460 (+) Transcript_9063:3543-4922(+)